MTDVQTRAMASARRVDLVDVAHIINRLTGLARHHEELGKVSHALGVHSAIELIKRDLASQRKAKKVFRFRSLTTIKK